MDNCYRMIKGILSVTAGIIIFSASPFAVEADSVSEDGYIERMETLDLQIEENQEILRSVTEEISAVEDQAKELISSLEQTSSELEEVQSEIQKVSDKIGQRESQLESQARAIQVTAQSGNVLRFILAAESVGDAFGRYELVSTLFSASTNLMQHQIDDKEKIAENERRIVASQEEQTLIAAQLENTKIELEAKQAEQELLLASVAAERAEAGQEQERMIERQNESRRRYEETELSRTAASQVETADPGERSEEVVISSSSVAEDVVSQAGSGMISAAQNLIGSPYFFSGTSPSGFDCSGFTQFVFQRSGKVLPRTAAGQFTSSTRLSRADARPGDLIFFSQSGSVDHVGIYLGGGRFIGAQTSTGVAVASFTTGYWSNHVVGFGRP